MAFSWKSWDSNPGHQTLNFTHLPLCLTVSTRKWKAFTSNVSKLIHVADLLVLILPLINSDLKMHSVKPRLTFMKNGK